MTDSMLGSMRGTVIAAALAVGVAGCDMNVTNPTVLDASQFDPTGDANTLAMSAQSLFTRAYANIIPYSGMFSEEVWVGAVRQETNDIGRRVMTAGTSDVNSALWSPLQRALATNELTIDLLGVGETANTVHLARAAMNSGFSMVLIAEHFCQGTIRVGPALEPDEMLDVAVTRFERAIDVADGLTGAVATTILNASRVGLGRAYLQQKDYANAATAVAAVPDAFLLNAVMIDDANNRVLGNLVYSYDFASRLLVVPPDYRALNDPRVPWVDTGLDAQATELDYYQQLKYTGYTTPIRIASGLEARYIEAEALLMGTPSSTTAALDLIAERRAVGGQGAFAGTTQAEILAELMDQRARDFWLEAKHTGDWRRNPAATPYVAPAGTPFYKPTQGNFADETCLPVPLAEVNANPNF